jgi:hypothetical protein
MPDSVAPAITDATAVRVALGASLVSLLLSGWAFLGSLDDADVDRAVEERLACLELPGDNDCDRSTP